ncbi:MAG: transglutaminase domain-containing protein [Bacteroidales bacterium]
MKRSLSIFLILLLCWGCTKTNEQEHFLKDKTYREKVITRFNQRKEFAKNRSTQLFSVFDKDLNLQEKEALQFIYAYMPLNDMADYDGDFFLKQVRASFDARNSFDWGKTVPDELFRHFVLPYRINNENMDSARMVFLEELKPRLQGMSMKDAALEVNHWCHEKVNYTPSDMRTSGPLSTLRTSWGRCGEESTFTVTAMRSVGIPARQVYTPRWAHCDDNHAWVEVWTDGKWSYLGACEPETDLDMGWFTEPARRAMLVHTKVFGNYQGKDEVVRRSDNFTEINVVKNYADVNKIYVKAVDQNSNPVKDARIDFGLYNYAEFYPIVKKYTNDKGLVSLTTGLGDLLITASKNGAYTNKKVTVANIDTLVMVIGEGFFADASANINFTPPIEKDPFSVDESKKAENQIRLDKEDQMRADYRKTFIDSVAAYKFAEEKNINPAQTWKLFKKSHGNWKEIKKFIETAKNKDEADQTLSILELVAEKDLRDTRSDILEDHLYNTINKFKPEDYASKEIYLDYVLKPRIYFEWMIPYRAYLQNQFKDQFKGQNNEKVQQIKDWIIENITINNKENYYNLPITPKGVNELKISNELSRDIFFVALCRSFGIPARLEPAQKLPQYYNGEKWITIFFTKQNTEQPIVGYLHLNNTQSEFDPKYYSHFTIGKLKDGVFKTLDYDWDKKLSDFKDPMTLEVGEYRLITGKRGFDGTVYTHFEHFNIDKDKTENVDLRFRDLKVDGKVLGHIKTSNTVIGKDGKENKISDLKKKNAILMIWVEPGKEPTRHVMEEFKAAKQKYTNWNGHIAIMQNDEITNQSLNNDFFVNMPANYSVYKDKGNIIFNKAKSELGISGKVQKPLILILTPDGDIKFASKGYKIGIHEHVLKFLDNEI